jgi:hypothetical protein
MGALSSFRRRRIAGKRKILDSLRVPSKKIGRRILHSVWTPERCQNFSNILE